MKPTARPSSPALPPVQTEAGVLVHSAADRRLATEHWLLSTLTHPQQGRQEWKTHGVALLPLGGLFAAIRLPAPLVLAVAAVHSMPSPDIDAILAEVLEGGPVICDPRHERYYALVPATVPTSWRAAADDWRAFGVGTLGRGCLLGVPRLTDTTPHGLDSYWSVAPESMAMLCTPLAVARLIAAGQELLANEPASSLR